MLNPDDFLFLVEAIGGLMCLLISLLLAECVDTFSNSRLLVSVAVVLVSKLLSLVTEDTDDDDADEGDIEDIFLYFIFLFKVRLYI